MPDPKEDLRSLCKRIEQAVRSDVADHAARVRQVGAQLAALQAEPHCWHCQVSLLPEPPARCESCPAPGDCDTDNCQEPGCLGIPPRQAEVRPLDEWHEHLAALEAEMKAKDARIAELGAKVNG